MELQLQKKPIQCLRTVLREVQSQEQTQQIRVSDGMPDIGRILGVWGQVILRGKEWEADSIRVTGGTMVWVQYLSEDGEETAAMESWLPFQIQWKLPEDCADGRIFCQSFLNNLDARSISARKMILRTGISVLAEAVESCQYDVFTPEGLPEDLQIRTERCPVQLPVEAGEKAFALDELLSLPPDSPGISRILSCQLQPEVTEEKIMGDKLVFRGKARLHLHYSDETAAQHSRDMEIPFSQYCELDREYPQTAHARIWPSVTALETELQQEQIHLKAGLVCQYRLCADELLEFVTDVYSITRPVSCTRQTLELPVILETKCRTVVGKADTQADWTRLADVQFLLQPVNVRNREDCGEVILEGRFRPVYYDADGTLNSVERQWSETVTVPADGAALLEATVWPKGPVSHDPVSGSGQLQAQLELYTETRPRAGLPAVSALELGEPAEPDPDRPSLILMRAGEQTLWDIAKQNASTVELIRAANGLQAEPEQDQMLLIPVP